MSEQFSNDAETTLDGSITDVATTLDVTSTTPFPAAPRFRLLIEAEGANSDEIVTVTGISGSTYTITRASESINGVQTASAHGDGAVIKHVLTHKALRTMGGFINSVKDTADTPDDEFDATTINGKWTVVSGSSGTAALIGTGSSPIYDLTTRPGWLLLQTGTTSGNKVRLRQDYTIPIGNSINIAFAISAPAIDGATGWDADEQQVGITLNSDDSAESAGSERIDFYAQEVDPNLVDVQTVGTGQLTGGNGTSTIWRPIGSLIFLRICRTATGIYYPFFSMDGYAWVPMDDLSFTTGAFNNIWIWAKTGATVGTPVPVHGVAWVRLGSNNLDPWAW